MNCQIVYNVNVSQNFSLFIFHNINTKETSKFKIGSGYNDYDDLLIFLHNAQNDLMIGYKNLNLWYPLLHELIEKREIFVNFTDQILASAINSKYVELSSNPFNAIKKPHIKQLDIFMLFNWDNPKKTCDLRKCQISLDFPEILDAPSIDKFAIISEKQIESLVRYEMLNIYTIIKCYESSRGISNNSLYKGFDEVKLRETLGSKHKLNLLNHSRVKLAEAIILKQYISEENLRWDDLQKNQDKPQVKLSDCIIENIKFKSKCFNDLVYKWKNRVILNMEKTEEDSVVFHGIKITYGLGGAHGSVAGVFKSENGRTIKDADVRGYYPSLISANRFRPEQFTISFNMIYDSYIYQRNNELQLPILSRDEFLISTNKLICNSIFGRFNYQKSPLYDPKCFMSITITGQLQISMLIEQLALAIPDIKFLSINTDGLICDVANSDIEKYNEICSNWSKQTGLMLDFEDYKALYAKDGANYLSVSVDGKVKRKGDFRLDKLLNESNSEKIVTIAINEYFLNNKSVSDTIRNHKNIYDFMTNINVGDDFTLIYTELINGQKVETILKNNARVVFGGNSGVLVKHNKHTGRQINLSKDKGVILMNKAKECNNINYGYYCRKATEIIEKIENKQLSMF